MKKIFLTSALAISMLSPAMADVDIAAGANTADCDSDVLKTTTGPANLEANWNANTINLNWYAGSDSNTPLTVQTGAQTCTYDGAITLPTTNPTKPGYTFARWQVRAPQCFAGVDVSVNGSKYYSYNHDDTCEINDSGWDASTCSSSEFAGMSAGQWAAEFSYGVVRGIASCNDTGESIWAPIETGMENGTMTDEQVMAALWGPNGTGFMPNGTFNSNSTGRYCWCHVESYTPNGGNMCSVASPSWVFSYDVGSASDCANDCADNCASYVQDVSVFRAAVFGVTQ